MTETTAKKIVAGPPVKSKYITGEEGFQREPPPPAPSLDRRDPLPRRTDGSRLLALAPPHRLRRRGSRRRRVGGVEVH
jgi:hypothetical protein